MHLDTDYTAGYLTLWAAVLGQAVKDLELPLNGNINDRRIRESAERWFESRRDGVGSCLWVCEQLDLDPAKVRARLKANRELIKINPTEIQELPFRIRQFRKEYKLSQSQFGRFVGLEQSSVSFVERGGYQGLRDGNRVKQKITQFLNEAKDDETLRSKALY